MINKIKYIAFLLVLISSFSLIGCSDKDSTIVSSSITKEEPEKEEAFFSYSEIPSSVKDKMLGYSMPESEPISFDTLSYLQLSYYGFDGKTHTGEMIVNKEVAAEVVEIFKELYEVKYPIEKIKLIDEYEANDDLSMKDNNTSSFCYRTIANTNVISNHGKGMAIDINPLLNPHINNSRGTVSPNTATDYIDRNQSIKGMIVENDDCYNAFIKRGWSWGGNWKNPDYQHFEKNINN